MKNIITILCIIFSISIIKAEPTNIANLFTSNLNLNSNLFLNNKSVYINTMNTILSFNQVKNSYDTIQNIYLGEKYYLMYNTIIGINEVLQKVYSYNYINNKYSVNDYRFLDMRNYTVYFYSGKYLAVRNNIDYNIQLYDLETKTLLVNFSEENNLACDNLCITPNEDYAIGIDNYELFKFDLKTLKKVKTAELPLTPGVISFVPFTDSNFVLSSGADIFFYDLKNLELKKRIENVNLAGSPQKVSGENYLIRYNQRIFDFNECKEISLNVSNTGLNSFVPYIDSVDTLFVDCPEHTYYQEPVLVVYNYNKKNSDTIFIKQKGNPCLFSRLSIDLFESYKLLSFNDYYYLYQFYYLNDINEYYRVSETNLFNMKKNDEGSIYYLKNAADTVFNIMDIQTKQITDSIIAYKPENGNLEAVFDISKKYLINKLTFADSVINTIYDMDNRRIIYKTKDDIIVSKVYPKAVKTIRTTYLTGIARKYDVNIRLLPDTASMFYSTSQFTEISADGKYIYIANPPDSTITKYEIETKIESKFKLQDSILGLRISADNQYFCVSYNKCGTGFSIYKTEDLSLLYSFEPINYIDPTSLRLLVSNNFKYLICSDGFTYFEVYSLNLPVSSVSNENELEAILNIFPNPAESSINVIGKEAFKEVLITDISGKVCLKLDSSNDIMTIDINCLSNGTYYLSAINDKYKVTKMFVVNK